MAHEHSHTEQGHDDHGSMTKGKIWRVFAYLLIITIVEFIIALLLKPKYGLSDGVTNFTYIILTLLKAFYIVAYFMHLRFEKYALITSIVISFVFIIYFIVLMLTEGSYLHMHMHH